METKKSRKADLESKRFLFWQAGMIVALALTFFAFEYKSYEARTIVLPPSTTGDIIDDYIPLPNTKPPAPTPPKSITIKEIDIDDEPDDIPDIDVYDDPVDALPAWEPIIAPDIPAEDDIPLLDFAPVMPTFPGGDAALLRYIRSNFVYPVYARERGITGIVYVNFIVEADGSISNVNLIRGIGFGCDEEALRVIGNMPKWNPGMQGNRAVRVNMNLPVRLQLR